MFAKMQKHIYLKFYSYHFIEFFVTLKKYNQCDKICTVKLELILILERVYL